MIELHLKIFGLTVDLEVKIPSRKKPNDVIETPNNVNSTNKNKINFVDEIEDENIESIKVPTSIELQAKQFEHELKTLGIYDIPNATDLPPTYGINDDVEIITDSFEKEQQDMIERNR